MNALVDLFELLEKNTKTPLTLEDIESIRLDSPLHLLKALYFCEDYTFLDSNRNPSLNKSNITQTFGYKSSFHLSFIANKDSLNESYLNARKALYKTMMNLRDERLKDYKREQNRIYQLSYEEYTQEKREQERILIEKHRQSRLFNKNASNKDSHLILESNDKSSVIIFLDTLDSSNTSHISMSNLIHIHNNKIDIFTKDKSIIDMQEIVENYKDYGITLESLNSANTQIFLYSQLLIGSKESTDNPLYFGEIDSGLDSNSIDSSNLDSNSNIGLDETKPIYQLMSEEGYETKDSEETFTLQVFLNDNTLTLLNYSLLDSSLNIKLEYNSKDSKEILEREQTQREQIQKESTPIDSLTSTAFLHPILEDNEIKCPHNGVVKLKSNRGKSFKSKDIPMVLESDLLNSQIIGCTNNILGVPTPCNLVSIILPNARGLKKFNDDYPIMQDLVSSGVLSDKGFPLIATPKPNTFRINSPNPSNAKALNKEELLASINFTTPSLNIITHYKDLDEFYFTPTTYENRDSKDKLISNQTNFYNTYKQIDIELDSILKDKNTLDSGIIESNQCLKDMLDSMLLSYAKEYFSYRIFSIRVAYSIYEYLLIIPKIIPKFIEKLLKEKRDKEEVKYGYGNFIDLNRDYIRSVDSNIEKEVSLDIAGKILLSPSGCERVRVNNDKVQ